ncbi:MAG TPA: hypothetical protein V6C65_09485 [Allocoleopsis sp.]
MKLADQRSFSKAGAIVWFQPSLTRIIDRKVARVLIASRLLGDCWETNLLHSGR